MHNCPVTVEQMPRINLLVWIFKHGAVCDSTNLNLNPNEIPFPSNCLLAFTFWVDESEKKQPDFSLLLECTRQTSTLIFKRWMRELNLSFKVGFYFQVVVFMASRNWNGDAEMLFLLQNCNLQIYFINVTVLPITFLLCYTSIDNYCNSNSLVTIIRWLLINR